MVAKQVWKFPVRATAESDEVNIDMPLGARVLSVGVQRNVVCIWALVDPAEPMQTRRFRVAGTGHPISDEHTQKFVGTFQLMDGSLIFHLFDISAVV